MSEAEAHDLNLFVAPERLLKSRRMLASGLFQSDRIEILNPSNDNGASAARPGAQKSGSE